MPLYKHGEKWDIAMAALYLVSNAEFQLAQQIHQNFHLFHGAQKKHIGIEETYHWEPTCNTLPESVVSMAAVRHDCVNDITPAKESWDIVVKVVRLWFVPDMNSKQTFYAMEMILMDEKGDKIQASVRKALLPRFQSKISDGFVYNFKSFGVAANSGSFRTTKHKFKLSLQSGTVVTKVESIQITGSPYSLVTFPEIIGKLDTDYLIDVVAIVSSVGRERVYERNRVTTRFKVIELESNGMKLDCTLFGTYVDALDAFLQSGYTGKVIVLAQYLKVKLYNGKVQLQNAMNCTNLLFNPEIPEANSLRLSDSIGSPTQPFSYMKDASEMSLEEDFLNLSQCKTIEELKDSQNDMVCVVLGTINHVVGGNDWWYPACSCNKGVVADSKRFYCPKCSKHVWTIVPRYRVKLRVIDETDSATFVLFDRDCYFLTKKTCTELIEEMDRADEPAIMPKCISGLVEQTMLFKIDVKNDVNSGFEQSFRVKKVCADKEIVAKFKNVVKNVVGVEEELAAAVDQSMLDVDVVQDLSSKFNDVVADDGCEENDSVSKHEESDVAVQTPIKREFVEVAEESDGSNSRITKNIKIEKD